MKCLKTILFTLLFSITLDANALLLLEPHLGYTLVGTGESSATPATMIKHNGFQYGLRTGAMYNGFMGGLDFTHSSFDQLTSGYSNNFSRNEMGLFVGYNFPILIRVWTTYNFSYNQEANSSSSLITSGSKYKGHSIELGAGYSGFPYVSLNAALRMITLDELTTPSATTSLSGDLEINGREFVLSVSAPFNLF